MSVGNVPGAIGSTAEMTVVVPTYGRSDTLARLLDALRAQRGVDVEIVVVDQNPPGTLPESWLRGTRHIHQAEPNVSAARNAGFATSRTDILLFIDDDLVPDPTFCARVMDTFAECPEVGCLCPVVVAGSEDVAAATATLSAARIGRSLAAGRVVEIAQTISACLAFRRTAYAASGGFDPILFAFARATEDQELFVRMKRRGLSVWADLSLTILHDEAPEGGCGLRSENYWSNRERFVRGWVFRYRAHGGRAGRLGPTALWRLVRSAMLNRLALMAGPQHLWRHSTLLGAAIRDTRRVIAPHLSRYRAVNEITHL